jgi:hypothetical protein
MPIHQLLRDHKKRRRDSDTRFTTRMAPPALRSRDEAWSESRSTDHGLSIIRPVPPSWSPSIPRAHNSYTKPIPNHVTYPTPLSHSPSPRGAMYPPSRANRELNFPNLAHRSSSSVERSVALPSVERTPSRIPEPGSGWGRIAGSRHGTPVWSSMDD